MSDLTTSTWNDANHPAWSVSGPNGTVTYRLLGNHLHFEPAHAVSGSAVQRIADQARMVAVTDTDDDMYTLLTGHYNVFPGSAPGVPETLDEWRQLRGKPLEQALHHAKWWPWPDDTIGGWAIMPLNTPPSNGVPSVGAFLGPLAARHIAALHNEAVLPHIGGTR